jgi:hypothetical protein
MVADFEAVSLAMSDPAADLDALTNKMARLQVRAGCTYFVQLSHVVAADAAVVNQCVVIDSFSPMKKCLARGGYVR